MRRLIPVLFVVLTTISLRAAESPGDRILGEWRGSSICTNRELTPACKDEQVRYVVTRKPKAANTYHVVAEKLVSGAYQPMGEMDFVYSEKEATWFSDFDVPPCRNCRWWYRLDGSELVGGLTDHEGRPRRKVNAQRSAQQ